MGVKNHQKLLVTTGLTALAMFLLSFSSFAKGEYIMGDNWRSSLLCIYYRFRLRSL